MTSRAENLENPSISEEIAEENAQEENSSERPAEGISEEQNKETPPVQRKMDLPVRSQASRY